MTGIIQHTGLGLQANLVLALINMDHQHEHNHYPYTESDVSDDQAYGSNGDTGQ